MLGYNKIEDTPDKFFIVSNSNKARVFTIVIVVVGGPLLALLINGFSSVVTTATICALPVIILVFVIITASIPFSILIDRENVVVVRRWLGRFTMKTVVPRSQIVSVTKRLRRYYPLSLIYHASLQVTKSTGGHATVFSAAHYNQNMVRNDTNLVCSKLSNLLNLSIDDGDFNI